MSTKILYRKGVDPDADQVEIDAAVEAGFSVIHNRTLVLPGDLIVGRMSVLPFYRELEQDIRLQNGYLINSFREHQFIADMREWCQVLGNMTPRLYERLQDVPQKGPFVVKGQTNSKKHLWNTHMFAWDKCQAIEVSSRLREDMLLADQEIYVRDFVPLQQLGQGLNGLPITNEFRFFVCRGQILCGAFYWASHTDDINGIPDVAEVPMDFVQQAVDAIGDNASFYALDVAKTALGPWIVIEINDGQMSGLSCNDPFLLYSRLKEVLK